MMMWKLAVSNGDQVCDETKSCAGLCARRADYCSDEVTCFELDRIFNAIHIPSLSYLHNLPLKPHRREPLTGKLDTQRFPNIQCAHNPPT